MKQNMPTDFDPSAGIVRPDQAIQPVAQPMPTLADFGVPVRSSGNAGTSAPVSKPGKGSK